MKKSNTPDEKVFPAPRTKADEETLEEMFRTLHEICEVRYEGLENITDMPCIFAPNHSSHLDTAIVYKAVYMKRGKEHLEKMCCLAAEELAEEPAMKKIFKAIGAIPIDRKGNPIPALRALNKCVKEQGYSALVFPEGTRTRTGEMGEFLMGTASAAIRAQVPVIPVGIVGTYQIWPYNCKTPRVSEKRRVVTVSFGKPIYPFEKRAAEMIDSVRNAVKELCEVAR